MKVLKLALCAATASLFMAGAAAAQDAPTVTFNIGATSDYVFRGVSQTDEGPAIQGGVDLSSGIFYAGLWASNVDFYDSTDAEIDAYVGIKPTAGAVTFDLAAIYYGYVNAPSSSDYAFWEFKAAASVPAGPLTLGAAAYYSPEFFGGVGDSLYYEANVAVSPADKWTITAAVGKQTINDFSAFDYTTYNIGVGYAFTDKISGDLRFHDGDLGCGSICDSRVAVSLKAVLP